MARKVGSKNKRTIAQQELAGEDSPLAYLLKAMKDESLTPGVRLQAATAAAAYIHSKPQAEIKHSGRIQFERLEDVIVDPSR
jgi:hypothetical protein